MELLATSLAILAVGLLATALLMMSTGDFRVAGACFLSASLVIYLRESKVLDD